ncbi:SDR family oxidoreductase [Streptomyces nigra]|uniref:SDR family oxidoreductase n=1 Tax=Streptomyces nigra TaxID=1827580 RepID=UPI000D525DAA|nr:NAD(P)H-binding protein [Streptomyces nigra]AWE48489.1 NmrA family protein [Streptomyces nigra]
MKVFIAGGRGRVGSPLADTLEAKGIEVVSGGLEDGIDVISGKGLAEALAGVDTIVNVLNTPRFDADGAISFFEGSIKSLTAEGERAGVRHHIVLSIVGVGEGDASEIGYYLGKVAQEKAVRSASIPATIIRATQFQSYIPALIDQHTVDGKVLAPRTFIQPVELAEVIDLLAEAVTTPKPGGEVEIAGPDRFYHDDLFRATLAHRGDDRQVVTVDGKELLEAMIPRGAYRRGTVRYPIPGIPIA